MKILKTIPDISVVMPVFNSANYVSQAVESILSQTYREFEFLIVDDGSTDESLKIIKLFDDPRIRLVCNKHNRGIVYSLNNGINLARGKYIARMDADDISLPDRFEKQYQHLEANPDDCVVGGQGYVIDEDGNPISPLPVLTVFKDIHNDLINNLNRRAIIHPAVMYRTDVIKKLGGYRETFTCAEDLDLFLRVAELGKITNLDSIVIHYRAHINSVTYKHKLSQRDSAINAAIEARKRLGLPLIIYQNLKVQEKTMKCDDYMYSRAVTALKYGNRKTAYSYQKKLAAEFGFTPQLIKLTLRILGSFLVPQSHPHTSVDLH